MGVFFGGGGWGSLKRQALKQSISDRKGGNRAAAQDRMEKTEHENLF